MPDFDRLAAFKRRTLDAEGVWVAAELEKAWLYGCEAALKEPVAAKPLRKSNPGPKLGKTKA